MALKLRFKKGCKRKCAHIFCTFKLILIYFSTHVDKNVTKDCEVQENLNERHTSECKYISTSIA
jgi:hypothetical protein